MLNLLKWWLCGKELAELERRRRMMQEYDRWLCQFEDIELVLKNMELDCKDIDVAYADRYSLPILREKIKGIRANNAQNP